MASYIELIGRLQNNMIAQDGQGVLEVATSLYHKMPGFFTPFRNTEDQTKGEDFTYALMSPISTPLTLGLVAVMAAGAAVISTMVCFGSLLFAGASCPFDSEIAEDALIVGLCAGLIALIALAAALALVLLAVVSVPLSTLSFITRSATTASLLCCAPADEEDESDDSFDYLTHSYQ
ncbi:MAG: hypothetical protein H0U57_01100 [Tatlockia sp.]|nr:hypothetical protein [Tatlockia sp.]